MMGTVRDEHTTVRMDLYKIRSQRKHFLSPGCPEVCVFIQWWSTRMHLRICVFIRHYHHEGCLDEGVIGSENIAGSHVLIIGFSTALVNDRLPKHCSHGA